ncbi:MAG: sigma-70 family RNA polymerase sigma factor [Nannocystaceae bacterium]|nr:sigma-70 family RNA polymerase sigma factor [Nannocystaceae bacterium]
MHPNARARLQRALADLAAGERRAFDDVFAVAWPVLRSLAGRLLGDTVEAEDVAQHALLKLFANASRFDPKRDALPWVLTFVINEVRTVRGRRRRRPLAALVEVPCSAGSPESRLMDADLISAVREIAGTLTHEDRMALGLEGAQTQDAAPATLRKRKQRALDRLRNAWRRIHGLA